ncbi:unnamed protein product, partial [Laminaria digitata]
TRRRTTRTRSHVRRRRTQGLHNIQGKPKGAEEGPITSVHSREAVASPPPFPLGKTETTFFPVSVTVRASPSHPAGEGGPPPPPPSPVPARTMGDSMDEELERGGLALAHGGGGALPFAGAHGSTGYNPRNAAAAAAVPLAAAGSDDPGQGQVGGWA